MQSRVPPGPGKFHVVVLVLLQQSIAILEGISAHFSDVYCTIMKEMRGREIFKLPG